MLPKKVIYKAAKATGEFHNKIVKTKPVIDENSKDVEEIIIPLEKERRNIKRVKTSFIKMEHYKIS